MTALPGRRRRSTLIAAGAAVLGVLAAMALGTLGALTLYNSTEGADASSGQPELVFPSTPTALLAAVDDTGALASMAVLVVQPAGQGGSIVTVPVDADATGGLGDGDRRPVAETAALQGSSAVGPEVETLLGLGLDTVEVADAARLAAIFEPFGPLTVDLPADVTDAEGDVVAEAGEQTMDAEQAAAVLTARDPSVPAVEQYPAAGAVWAAVAAAIGDGIAVTPDTTPATVPAATTAHVPAGTSAPDSPTVAEVLAAVAGGPTGHRPLRTIPIDAAANPRGVDVVRLDPAELALVFGQIAPGRVAAPNPALSVRIESNFSEAQLADLGLTNTDVAYRAAAQILFVGGNVLSVDTAATPDDEPGTSTLVEVADETLVAGTEGASLLFGDLDVEVGETRIVGIDAVIRLGTRYLDLIREQGTQPPTIASLPTVPDTLGTTDTTPTAPQEGG
ncbi:MAG: hypothetical protein ABW328_00930 [Ilumatobacteraceae bacterium]